MAVTGSIARATLRTSAVLGLRLLVQASTLLLVARILGPVEFGAFAGIAALAVLMGTFATFGTHLVLLAEVAKNPARRDAVLTYALPTTLMSGGLLFAGYLLVCWLLFAHVGLPLVVIACIGLTETLLLPLFTLPATEELALEKTARSQLLMVLPLTLRTLAAGAVWWLAPAQPLLVFAWLYLASAVLALGLMRAYKPHAWPAPSRWRLASRAELKYSAGYAALALTAAGPAELDKMLAVKLLPLGASGLYAAASRVIGAATLPVVALLLSAMPRLFRHSAESPAQARRLNRWIFASVFIYGLVLAGLLWLAAPLVQQLFGSAYHGMAQMLQWLCLAVPALALRISVASILMTMERPWRRAGFEVMGMATLVIAALALYPPLGAKGMALALAASEWGMVVVGYKLIVKNL